VTVGDDDKPLTIESAESQGTVGVSVDKDGNVTITAEGKVKVNGTEIAATNGKIVVDKDGKVITSTSSNTGSTSGRGKGSSSGSNTGNNTSVIDGSIDQPASGYISGSVNSFKDVAEGAYYYDAVMWAVEKGVTTGTSENTFSPDVVCTRAQAVTFLWRAAGEPEPTDTAMPFADVADDAYYRQAVLWAVEKGITKGTSADKFSPDDTCTRAQIAAFMWRSQGQPESGTEVSFTDVASDAYYAAAVSWAAENGITNGTTATTFSPDDFCTRGQIVTFLYRNDKISSQE
jgi:hypothetical protein